MTTTMSIADYPHAHNPPGSIDGELVEAFVDVDCDTAWVTLQSADSNRPWEFDLLSGQLIETTCDDASATYPIFVYGTLRPGEHNYRCLLAAVSSYECRASLKGAAMFAGPGFPYVTRRGVGAVTGDLIWVDDYQTTLARLDQLEGYQGPDAHNHYDRILTEVTTDTGEPVTAWVYFAGDLVDLQRLQPIESGDWFADVFMAAAS